MPESNYERMIQLAESVFDTKSDPDQLDVDEKVIERLLRIHPSTVSEYDDGKGPVVWILVLPTTSVLMNLFLNKEISEKELFYTTPIEATFDTIYLCSAMVLEEYRGKGLARKMTLEAIENIKKEHPIKTLFVWAFSKEGDGLAVRVAQLTGLPLLKLE
jgi:predicted GNAT family acetyltransferase